MFRVTLRFPPLAYRYNDHGIAGVAAIHNIIYRPGSLCHRNVVTGIWSSIPPRPPGLFFFSLHALSAAKGKKKGWQYISYCFLNNRSIRGGYTKPP